MFNLVFVTNTASVRLWKKLGFQEIGILPKAGRLKNHEDLVDAIMFYYPFEQSAMQNEQRYASPRSMDNNMVSSQTNLHSTVFPIYS